MPRGPEVYLASSALIDQDFDGLATIHEAHHAGFDGVQLFLDHRYWDPEYLETAIAELNELGLGLVLHLPNEVEEADLAAAERFVDEFPDARVLIHYLPATESPNLNGSKVGWENSKTAVFDFEVAKAHIEEVRAKVRGDNSFFVFDIGRLLYADNQTSTPEQVIEYLGARIHELDPNKDVIHLSDKTSWILRFRDCMCVLGDGVSAKLLRDICSFTGVIIFEHEDLQMALDSLEVVRRRVN